MKYFLIGVVVGVTIGLVGAYFITKPKVTHERPVDPGYTMIRFEDEGRWVKLIVNDTGYVCFENGIDTLKLLKHNQ